MSGGNGCRVRLCGGVPGVRVPQLLFECCRDGFELGRLEGDAEWDSEEAVRMLRHFIDQGVRPPRMMRTGG